MELYSDERVKTKNHIFLHALHQKIIEKFYGGKRLTRNIKYHDKYKDYKRAWDIVKEEDAGNIIKKFRELTKR